MTSRSLDAEQDFTLHNGTIVSNSYARARIIAWLARWKIPLSVRRVLANEVINDPWHRGCLVTFIQYVALELWFNGWHLRPTATAELLPNRPPDLSFLIGTGWTGFGLKEDLLKGKSENDSQGSVDA